ncbi:MAG TPA: hypothetical protein VJZ91_08550, partial [Blastocatellia bacterium]|nr:hypothetical protein [Blastocatellia bacterium]
MHRIFRGEFPAIAQRHPLAGKTARTLALFVALALLPYALPPLSRYRVLVPASLVNLISVRAGLASDAQAAAQEGSAPPAGEDVRASAVRAAKPGEIEDPTGHAL